MWCCWAIMMLLLAQVAEFYAASPRWRVRYFFLFCFVLCGHIPRSRDWLAIIGNRIYCLTTFRRICAHTRHRNDVVDEINGIKCAHSVDAGFDRVNCASPWLCARCRLWTSENSDDSRGFARAMLFWWKSFGQLSNRRRCVCGVVVAFLLGN